MEVTREDQVKWLRQEMTRWAAEGLITTDQADRILAQYRGQERLVVRTQAQGRLVAVLGILGAILVGLGVILFFAANWQALPRWSKFSLVLGATAGTYLLGYWLRFRRGYVGMGAAVLLLGAFLYGAGIFLVRQMFNVQAEPHYGLLLWAVGILPLGYVLPLDAMIALGALLGAVWVSVVGFFGLERYGLFGEQYWVVPLRNMLAAGIAFYSIGDLHARFRAAWPFRRPYIVAGLITLFVALYLYTIFVGDVLSALSIPKSPVALPSPLWRLEAGLAILAVGLLVAGVVWRGRPPWKIAETATLAVVLIATWIIPPAIPVLWRLGTVLTLSVSSVLISNILFFGASLGAIALGVQRSDRALLNTGLVFFAIGVATRYVDVVGPLLDRSLFFIGGGVLLLGGGWLVERTRRRLLRQMEAEAE